jgi:dipeptidyl aminopeptidase/acylaminoacyl peptidase
MTWLKKKMLGMLSAGLIVTCSGSLLRQAEAQQGGGQASNPAGGAEPARSQQPRSPTASDKFDMTHVGTISQLATAADRRAPGGRGKITLHADFLEKDPRAGSGLHVVDPTTDRWTEVASFPPRNGIVSMSYLRVSPDGTRVAFNEFAQPDPRSPAYPASVWLRDLRPGASPRKISDIHGRPIWSPDGKQLLLSEFIGEARSLEPGHYATWRIEEDGSHPVRLPIPQTDEVWDWSPDGRWLAVLSPGQEGGFALDLVVMHPDGTGKRSLTKGGRGLFPRFSPDGMRMAYAPDLREQKSIWVVDIDSRRRRRVYVEQGDSFIERVTWSPDGRQLAAVMLTWSRDGKGGRFMGGETFGSPRLCILNLDDGRIRFIPHPPARVLGDLDWR